MRNIFLFFLVVAAFNSKLLPNELREFNNLNFDDSRARKYWNYQIMTECLPKRIELWNVPPISQLFPKVSDITVIYNSTGSNIGYVAYDSESSTSILAFGGTHNLDNWLEDLNAFFLNFDKCQGCEVHKGFYQAFNNLKDKILASFINLVSKHQNSRTAIIGHSLGAGMATFAFMSLYDQINIDDFYTFGSPRIGNNKFVEYFNGNFEKTTKARITHNKDPVPHLPSSILGYSHVNTEIFYQEDSTKFIICKENIEDPVCSLQFPFYELSPDDHTNYMGFNIRIWRDTCN